MPDYNALQTDRFERFAKRAAGIRNAGILPTFAPELSLSLDLPLLEDMELPAAYARFGWYQTLAPTAGQRNYFVLFNGTTRSLVGVRLTLGNSTGGTRYVLGITEAAIAIPTPVTPSDVNWRDTRRVHTSLPVGGPIGIGAGTGAGTPPIPGLFNAASLYGALNQSIELPWVVLKPGTGVVAWDVLVNTAGTCSGDAWIRTVDPDELASL